MARAVQGWKLSHGFCGGEDWSETGHQAETILF